MDYKSIEFPVNVFEDVKGEYFSKHNKKNVTEDFVTENMKAMGWDVYRPFNDTGIDLIATKAVCKNCFNDLHNKNISNKCLKCSNELINIKRFIQVKTREIKGTENNGSFGFTLKSKDIRTDPRHVFLLYSDYSNDFLFIGIYDYLKLFSENTKIGKSHFSTPSFRKGNNKQNSLKRDDSNNWSWSGISFNDFLNEKGLIKICNPEIETNLVNYISETQKLKFDLFYNYSKGKNNNINSEKENSIRDLIKNKVENNLTFNSLGKRNIVTNREFSKKQIISETSDLLRNSIEKGYFVKFKGISFYEE
jgi:hypothetical protein